VPELFAERDEGLGVSEPRPSRFILKSGRDVGAIRRLGGRNLVRSKECVYVVELATLR
jgi:hypothetical protein